MMVLMEELALIALSTYTGGYSEQTNDIVKLLSFQSTVVPSSDRSRVK